MRREDLKKTGRILTLCLMAALLLRDGALAGGVLGDMLYADGAGWSETTLGDVAADAVRLDTGAEAVILPARMLAGSLRGGEVTAEETEKALDNGVELAICTVTWGQVFMLLERGLAALVLDERERLDTEASASPLFPQISGFTLRADASAPVGARVMTVKTQDGAEVSPEETLTLCTDTESFAYLGVYARPLAREASVLLLDYIASGALENGVKPGRIEVSGTLDDSIAGGFPPLAMVVVMAVVLVFSIVYVKHNGRPASRRYGTR